MAADVRVRASDGARALGIVEEETRRKGRRNETPLFPRTRPDVKANSQVPRLLWAKTSARIGNVRALSPVDGGEEKQSNEGRRNEVVVRARVVGRLFPTEAGGGLHASVDPSQGRE